MCNARPPVPVDGHMGTLLRYAAIAGLIATLGLPAGAAAGRCTHDVLTIDGVPVTAAFCIPAEAAAPSVSVTETFAAQSKVLDRTASLTIVPGAQVSRAIDDVDLAPLGLKRTLHMTLAYRAGTVVLEHALALPGAIPVK